MIGRLHIVPKLVFVRSEALGPVSLSMIPGPSSLDLVRENPTISIVGDDVRVAVGGFEGFTNGWTARLLTEHAKSDSAIAFDWRAAEARVIHIISFELTDLGAADDPLWTMDPSYWVLAGYAETRNYKARDHRKITAVAAFSAASMPETHERSFATRFQDGAFIIEERLTLHAIERQAAVNLVKSRHAAAAPDRRSVDLQNCEGAC